MVPVLGMEESGVLGYENRNGISTGKKVKSDPSGRGLKLEPIGHEAIQRPEDNVRRYLIMLELYYHQGCTGSLESKLVRIRYSIGSYRIIK